MWNLNAITWPLDQEDKFTFSVEVSIFLGFLIITVLLFVLIKRYPQLTKNGWIELVIGAPFMSLKGLFDFLDTLYQDVDLIHDIFDSFEAVFIFLGIILLGVGLLRIALYSAKIWEVS